MNIWLTLYLAIAALVTAGAFYGGVINRRPVKLFTEAEQVILGLTTILVGLLWPLFVPGLTVFAVRHIRRHVAAHGLGWFENARALRARG
mgnify:CR=1 FL=1